jgi:hypothetical protein
MFYLVALTVHVDCLRFPVPVLCWPSVTDYLVIGPVLAAIMASRESLANTADVSKSVNRIEDSVDAANDAVVGCANVCAKSSKSELRDSMSAATSKETQTPRSTLRSAAKVTPSTDSSSQSNVQSSLSELTIDSESNRPVKSKSEIAYSNKNQPAHGSSARRLFTVDEDEGPAEICAAGGAARIGEIGSFEAVPSLGIVSDGEYRECIRKRVLDYLFIFISLTKA